MKNKLSGKIDEVNLWNNFREGDEKAFAQLFDVFSDRLYFYGIKFIYDREMVKDCIQDLFIKIYSNRESLPHSDNPLFYLFRSLKNRIIDELQNNDKITYLSQQDLPFIVSYHQHSDEEQEDDDKSSEIKEKLEKILNQLPDRQKEAVYLRYKMGMSYDEISLLLGINYQSARNLIHRAIEKIKTEMNLALFISLVIKYL